MERGRLEYVLRSQRQGNPKPDDKPIYTMSDDALLTEIDYRMGENWAVHYEK